jgi:N-acylneuraminate cytidylyltransferase
MKIVSLIPARGGSKEVPMKNIINVNGKPLLSYSALESQKSISSETWVSTDCKKIKSTAIEYGCSVIDRPKEISTDNSKSEDALIHFAKNVPFDILVFIQATSPLITSEEINRGINMVKSKQYDSCFAASRESWLPRWTIDGQPHLWDINNRPMRQDVDDLYIESGGLYVTTRDQLINNNRRYGGKIGIIEVPAYKNLDINSYDDIIIVESILKSLNQ